MILILTVVVDYRVRYERNGADDKVRRFEEYMGCAIQPGG